MTDLQNYFNDGANEQAQATLCALKYYVGDGIEESYCEKTNKYLAEINVARWENCREQGYIVSLRTKDRSKQLNIAFFEHRNTDSICAIKWEQTSTNSLTIDTAQFGDVYKDKYDVSFDVGYGEFLKMASWINEQFIDFWVKNDK